MGFDSKHKFTPPTVLLGLLLCPWLWGISSQPLQHVSSYWGFSDLGHEVSPHGCSGGAQPPLLALDLGYLLTAAPCPTTSWQTDGEAVGTATDSTLGGSKITADGDCSHEIKRRLLLGRKVMTNLDSLLKSRDITLSTKVHLVKAMDFPVVKYGFESWTIKKAEC